VTSTDGLAPRDRLALAFSTEIVDAFARLIETMLEDRADVLNGEHRPEWISMAEAARRLECSVDAVRMRVKRGRLEARRQGRRVYVSAASVERLG
jgi:excisionase family DNA binding protein